MKKIVIIIFYIGFFFFGGGALVALGQFVLYNGFGNIFEYIKPDDLNLTIQKDTLNQKERYIISYSYIVKNKLYHGKDEFDSAYIKESKKDLSALYYNKNFPSVFYIEDNHLSLRRCKIDIGITMFFFLFLFSIYKFADLDKWINVYTKGEYKSTKK